MVWLSLWPGRAVVPDSIGQYRPLPDYPFVFVSERPDALPPQLPDSLFNAVAEGFRFEVNRTDIRPDDPFLQRYTRHIAPLLARQGMQLRQVDVRGTASPEGPYENNRRLGRERTLRLADFLAAQLGQHADTYALRTRSITEDYTHLVALMRADHDPDAERVARLWEDCGEDEQLCKQRLRLLDGGRLWQRLTGEYFPRLRRARVVIWCSRRPDFVPQDLPPVAATATVLPLPPAPALPTTCVLPVPPVRAGPAGTPAARQRLLAVRTNLLLDAFYLPQFGWAPSANVQVEYFPRRGHYTYNASFTFSNHRHWQTCEFFQVRDLRLSLRRYFKGGARFRGAYLDAYAQGAVYGIGLSPTKGWQGEGGGGGLGAGYTFRLNRKGSLRLECSVQAGAFYTVYDPYVYGDPTNGLHDGYYYYKYTGQWETFRKRRYHKLWLGPTEVGLHLTYDLLYHRTAVPRKGGGL